MMMFYLLFLSAIAEAGKIGGSLPLDFFREEYILNNAIGVFYHPASYFCLCSSESGCLTSWCLRRNMQEAVYRPDRWNNNGRGEILFLSDAP